MVSDQFVILFASDSLVGWIIKTWRSIDPERSTLKMSMWRIKQWNQYVAQVLFVVMQEGYSCHMKHDTVAGACVSRIFRFLSVRNYRNVLELALISCWKFKCYCSICGDWRYVSMCTITGVQSSHSMLILGGLGACPH